MDLKNCHSGLSLNQHHSVNWKHTIIIVLFYVLTTCNCSQKMSKGEVKFIAKSLPLVFSGTMST